MAAFQDTDIRLVELRRVLKPTGAVYLHYDQTASHYLNMLMDSIFGARNFKNNIAWKRTAPTSDFRQGATNWARVQDVLLYYVKDDRQGESRRVRRALEGRSARNRHSETPAARVL